MGADAADGPPRRRPHRRRATPAERAGVAAVALAGALAGAVTATVPAVSAWPLADALWRGLLAGTLVVAASLARTWAVIVLATGAAALAVASGPVPAGAGAAALLGAAALAALDPRRRRVPAALVGGLAAAALLRAEGGPFGATALASAALAAPLAVSAYRLARRPARRVAVGLAAGLAGCAVVAGVGGAVAAAGSAAQLSRAAAQADAGLAAARDGDDQRAAASLAAARADLGRGRARIEAWWARPAWALPVVGAHLGGASRLGEAADEALATAEASTAAVRLGALVPTAGQVDLEALAATEGPLAEVAAATERLRAEASRARSPWLLPPAAERLDRLEAVLARAGADAASARDAAAALPRMLGRDGPSRYFVAVANPAETRELGGFVGQYAVVLAERGRLSLERAGAVADIGADRPGRDLDGVDLPERFRAQRPELYWQNVTGTPDLPTAARAVRHLWPQVAPGQDLAGVAYVDPDGLAAFLRLAGPVTVEGLPVALTAETAAPFLHVGQYAAFGDHGDRRDALGAAAAAVFHALVTRPLPPPGDVVGALAPAVRGGHLAIAAFDPAAQRVLERAGLTGAFPRPPPGEDLASLRTSDTTESKLDAHVRRRVSSRVRYDPATGATAARVTITLVNQATPRLPPYVTGRRRRGHPPATSVLRLAWYSRLDLEEARLDGRAVPAGSTGEYGARVHTLHVPVPPGGQAVVELDLVGRLAPGGYTVTVAPQPTVTPDAYQLEVLPTPGWVISGGLPEMPVLQGTTVKVGFVHTRRGG